MIPLTFGRADRTPQSVMVVLISAGLIIKVYIPNLLNSVAGSLRLYNPPNISTLLFPPVSELWKYGVKIFAAFNFFNKKLSVTSREGV